MFYVIFMFLMLFKSRLTGKKTICIEGIGMDILMLLNGAGLVIYGFNTLIEILQGYRVHFSESIRRYAFVYA